MAGGREIKSKIKSVQNTRKVTRALEMVSASKIRKAQERMKASRPYARAMKQLIGVIKVMLDAYDAGNVDRVILCYNDFVNTMTQRAAFDPLLPLPAAEATAGRHSWDYIYEPDAQTVLDHLMVRYVESLVYQAVMENVASEHAARMVAMKAASDNATKLIGTLNLVYNKARQAAITQEISEIVGGAAAV